MAFHLIQYAPNWVLVISNEFSLLINILYLLVCLLFGVLCQQVLPPSLSTVWPLSQESKHQAEETEALGKLVCIINVNINKLRRLTRACSWESWPCCWLLHTGDAGTLGSPSCLLPALKGHVKIWIQKNCQPVQKQNSVSPITGQGSPILGSFAKGNCGFYRTCI